MILLECSKCAQQLTFKPYMCEICSCFTLNNPLWRSLERIAVRGKASVLKKVAAHCYEEVFSNEISKSRPLRASVLLSKCMKTSAVYEVMELGRSGLVQMVNSMRN